MKVDAKLNVSGRASIVDRAREVEKLGYNGIWTSEAQHDPFLPLVLAAEHTTTLEVGTAIAVAFARSPMNLAYLANDLQELSSGRFVLGLGSQVKAHIERRFAMSWSHPAARMRELVLALRAIWEAWASGDRLSFRGEFYAHTLMTPFFSPGPNPYGNPPVHVAAVGESMTAVAGEVADGLLAHPFTTARYLRERTHPALARGVAASGRSTAEIEVSCPVLIATALTEPGMQAAVQAVRDQIAFYGSTPAYRSVLELHGWEAMGDELNAVSVGRDDDRWARMGRLIEDEVLHAFAVVGSPRVVGRALVARYSQLLDRISFYTPYAAEPEAIAQTLSAFRDADTASHGGPRPDGTEHRG